MKIYTFNSARNVFGTTLHSVEKEFVVFDASALNLDNYLREGMNYDEIDVRMQLLELQFHHILQRIPAHENVLTGTIEWESFELRTRVYNSL